MLVTNIKTMGRWERTHEALQRAALELFAEHGFDGATAAQVAERAGVSEMTLFRHFSSKEALLLEDPFDPLLAEAVRARPDHEPAMVALAEGVRQAWAGAQDRAAPEMRARLRIVAATPTLRGAVARSSDDTVTALAGALGDRGVAPAPARVAAGALVAGLGVALLDWAASDQGAPGPALEAALDVLAGG